MESNGAGINGDGELIVLVGNLCEAFANGSVADVMAAARAIYYYRGKQRAALKNRDQFWRPGL